MHYNIKISTWTKIKEYSKKNSSNDEKIFLLENIAKPDNSAPDFTIELSDKISMISEKIVFECKVTGEPQPTITWFHEKVGHHFFFFSTLCSFIIYYSGYFLRILSHVDGFRIGQQFDYV